LLDHAVQRRVLVEHLDSLVSILVFASRCVCGASSLLRRSVLARSRALEIERRACAGVSKIEGCPGSHERVVTRR
jgi:hypothetical protein